MVNAVATAQTDYKIGSGTGSNGAYDYPCPLPDLNGSRAQYLIRASEMTAAGMTAGGITALKLNITGQNGAGQLDNIRFQIGHTGINAINTTQWATFTGTPVEIPAANYTLADGINTFTLPSMFLWDGVSNIMIEMCSGTDMPWQTSENPSVEWTTGLPFNAQHTATVGSWFGGNGCGLNDAFNSGNARTRPNFTLTWQTVPACSGQPVPGTVVSDKTSTCGSEVFHLTLSGNAVATGLSYQWQISADNTTWNNIPDATNPAYAGSQLSGNYYRVAVTCANGGQSANSAAVHITATPTVSGTFSIDNSVPASGSGTFKTFNEAYDFIKCGIGGPVIFNVKNTGVDYNEQLIMKDIPGASATNTVTFNGNGATISWQASDESRSIIKLDGADYVTIDSLVIKSLGSDEWADYGYGVVLNNDADFNTIKRCHINVFSIGTNGNFLGIAITPQESWISSGITNCDNNTFDHNTITGGYYGIAIAGDDNVPVANNKITNNKIIDFYYQGIYATGTYNTLVEHNDISRPMRTASSYTVSGIIFEQVNVGAKVIGNRVHNLYDSHTTNTDRSNGIIFSNADAAEGAENLIANNIIYNIYGLGEQYGIVVSGTSYTQVYHNTISFDETSSVSSKPTYALYGGWSEAFLDVKNNIYSIHKGGTGEKFAEYFSTPLQAGSVNYNNFFLADHGTISAGYYNAKAYQTLAEWKKIIDNANDTSSLDIDPGFKDPANGNFEPNSALLADKGLPVASVTADINNIARSTTKPDIGAYEYTLPGCLTSFTAGDAYSSVGLVTCPGKKTTLNLKNNDVGMGMTYIWESAPSSTGPWTAISTALQAAPFNYVLGDQPLYYRAAVSCNGGTAVYSTAIQINVGGAFPAGTYTIDKTQPSDPSGTKNFNSFSEAVAALNCGVAGPVIFNVKENTYEEQIRIGDIRGTSAANTVTFQSESGNATGTILTFNGTDVTKNYTLRLDSASHFIFRNLTLAATSDNAGRVLEILSMSKGDSIVNNIITAPEVTGYYDTYNNPMQSAGIIMNAKLTGGDHVISGNTITGGVKGVHLEGRAQATPSTNNEISSNIFSKQILHSIYAANAAGIKVRNNTIDFNATQMVWGNGASAGIYITASDSSIAVDGNTVTIGNWAGGNTAAISVNNSDAPVHKRASFKNNTITANDVANSSPVAGMDFAGVRNFDVFNNTVVVGSASSGSYSGEATNALASNNAFGTHYYNNSLVSYATVAEAYNATAYFDHQYYQDGGEAEAYNNIISNAGGGPAVFHNYSPAFVRSDYNLFHTSGATLIKVGPPNYMLEKDFTSLDTWIKAFSIDLNSIVYEPAFVSASDLHPDASKAASWAMQGRGVQIAGNDKDKEGNDRAVTLTTGVPDLGAFEFQPTVAPPVLTGIPATPAAGTTQHFLMGSDTVASIIWAPGAPVPSALTLRRYSGVLPDGLSAADKSMYYYVAAQPGTNGNFNFHIRQHYVGSWMRNLSPESTVKLGRTDAAQVWTASGTAVIDSLANVMIDSSLSFLDKFTGMTDGKFPDKPVFTTTADSSNKGTRFWAPYALNTSFFQGNDQEMLFRIAADQSSTVTVKVNGTSYSKTYSVAAGTVLKTDPLPKVGAHDARITDEGKYVTGVSIESDRPVAITAVTTGFQDTYAMLLPTGTYGYEYAALGYRQKSSYNPAIFKTSATVNVIADHDNTVVEITPSVDTKGGQKAGVPFQVTLQRGEVYQVLGADKGQSIVDGYDRYYFGTDLTGTTVKAIANPAGECYPVAVFSGSASTGFDCKENELEGTADEFFIQQNLPAPAWGKHYLTAGNTTSDGTEPVYYVYRIQVNNAQTIVKRNGTVMTGLDNKVYEFTSNQPEYIEADQPVQVAQFGAAMMSCGNEAWFGKGRFNSVVYLTPLGHGIKDAKYLRETEQYPQTETYNDLQVLIPDAGLASLKVNGQNDFTVTAHPGMPGYSIAMKRWPMNEELMHVSSDTTFYAISNTIIAPGIGTRFNLGMTIPRIEVKDPAVRNTLNIATEQNAYTCDSTPFRATIMLPVAAKSIIWALSQVTGAQPAGDIIENNPTPVDTVEVDFTDYYVYRISQDIRIDGTGVFQIPVTITYGGSGLGCDKSITDSFAVEVIEAPVVNYTTNYNHCVNGTATFEASGSAQRGAIVDRWNWNFGDNTTSDIQRPTKKWNTAGNYLVALEGIANDGCVGYHNETVTVNPLPVVAVKKDTVRICKDDVVTFEISNPDANTTYEWFTAATGGSPIFTGTTFTSGALNGDSAFYIGATANGCGPDQRLKVVAAIKITPEAPVVTVDSVTTNMIRFEWNAVANATGYEMSTDGGSTWSAPSSGSNGTYHMITNLRPSTTITIQVRATGGCEFEVSSPVSATTLTDNVFIPNSFVPGGISPTFRVYANNVKEMKMMVFNQWGQKVFETSSMGSGWDGRFNGKDQPSGVYVYVCRIILNTGEEINKKGSVNLIR
ncbi:hypothetical protein FPE01S_01_15940 [Flavihumibacter petaseus NBRC 106054]|uniref:Right handed beta helix domain-containing protein n=1 Tax=Flavihumibacter petaseus NBRC 106054 TaxID=1220578 RepID=A0A0E9MYB1_9BACT|nr:hypothetical protein FPE01S_01_15940 [Flavihumibacter petaseus NBRC 106054]